MLYSPLSAAEMLPIDISTQCHISASKRLRHSAEFICDSTAFLFSIGNKNGRLHYQKCRYNCATAFTVYVVH